MLLQLHEKRNVWQKKIGLHFTITRFLYNHNILLQRDKRLLTFTLATFPSEFNIRTALLSVVFM